MGVTAGIVGFGDLNNAGQEGPHLVRLRKADLKQRINGQLTLRYEAGGLTSFAGLELIGRFFRSLDLRGALRGAHGELPRSDFGSASMVLLVLTMLITGARRVRHVGHLKDDPLVRRVCGLSRIPTWHTLGRWLRGIDGRGVAALLKVNERLVGEVIGRSDLRRLTLDVDGSVVSTGLRVEGARRGFNPHRRKVPSHCPITAHESNTGQVVRVCNRAGNVHDGKASVGFVEALFEQRLRVPAWSRSMRLVIYRKRVRHRTAGNHQLDLFDPDDGHYEYSATVTNKAVTGRTLWFFMCGRGTHEKVHGELKAGFAFDCVPTQRYQANSAWQVLSTIAFNLMRALQARTAERRHTNRKRRAIRAFRMIHTLRHEFINRTGLLVQPNGRSMLDVGNNRFAPDRFQTIEQALAG